MKGIDYSYYTTMSKSIDSYQRALLVVLCVIDKKGNILKYNEKRNSFARIPLILYRI